MAYSYTPGFPSLRDEDMETLWDSGCRDYPLTHKLTQEAIDNLDRDAASWRNWTGGQINDGAAMRPKDGEAPCSDLFGLGVCKDDLTREI